MSENKNLFLAIRESRLDKFKTEYDSKQGRVKVLPFIVHWIRYCIDNHMLAAFDVSIGILDYVVKSPHLCEQDATEGLYAFIECFEEIDAQFHHLITYYIDEIDAIPRFSDLIPNLFRRPLHIEHLENSEHSYYTVTSKEANLLLWTLDYVEHHSIALLHLLNKYPNIKIEDSIQVFDIAYRACEYPLLERTNNPESINALLPRLNMIHKTPIRCGIDDFYGFQPKFLVPFILDLYTTDVFEHNIFGSTLLMLDYDPTLRVEIKSTTNFGGGGEFGTKQKLDTFNYNANHILREYANAYFAARIFLLILMVHLELYEFKDQYANLKTARFLKIALWMPPEVLHRLLILTFRNSSTKNQMFIPPICLYRETQRLKYIFKSALQ